MKLAALVALVVVVVLGGWYFFGSSRNNAGTPVQSTTATGTEQKVVVTKTDIAKNGNSLPAGFPGGIPVETSNLNESFRAAYPDRGVVQYSVSYNSSKSRDSLWDLYASYMQSAGYTLDKGMSNKSLGQIAGTRGSDTLSVSISEHGGISLVQINYLQR